MIFRLYYVVFFFDVYICRNVLILIFLKDSLFNFVKWCDVGVGVNKFMKLNKVYNFLFNEIDILN